MSTGGFGGGSAGRMTWGGTGGALDKYLDPPGRPESFIMLSQSGRNFLTSDKYMDGAKRRHFREAAQPIALGEVNYGIFQRPAEAPKEGAHIYDKEEVVLPGAVVAPASWRPVPKPALHNPFMMTPATRRLLLKQERAAAEARVYNRQIEQEVVRREHLMRHAYPSGVVGIDAPVAGSKVYADKAGRIKVGREAYVKHATGRRQNLAAKSRSVDYNILAHGSGGS